MSRELTDRQLETVIAETVRSTHNLGAFSDWMSLIEENYKSGEWDRKQAKAHYHEVRLLCAEEIQYYISIDNPYACDLLEKIYYNTYLALARDDFDSYCMFLESGREPDARFYEPRREKLKPLVRYFQMLADDGLDELGISMPPRTGKTTLVMFFMSWIMGKRPEISNLYVSYSDTICKSFYTGLLEIFRDSITYRWFDIFTERTVAYTNAEEKVIDIDRRKRYHTITCRSLYGTLNGSCDCTGFCIGDDLVSGIEEAMNPDRLATTWRLVNNDMLTRAKGLAKFLWIGTRWSMRDPEGIRFEMLEDNKDISYKRFKFYNMPAIDEKGHSNFEYKYNLGFSDEYYEERKNSFIHNNDEASWLAQYMGDPIERKGRLFERDAMQYYNGELPQGDPDTVFMAIDPAWGGGDYTAGVVCMVYSGNIFVPAVVFNNGDKTITQPEIASAIIKYRVLAVTVEASRSTASFAKDIEKKCKERGYRITVRTKPASTHKAKEDKIRDAAPDVREQFIFLERRYQSPEYKAFMDNVFSFTLYGKNKHDDAPDVLSQAVAYQRNGIVGKATAFRRIF